MILVDTSTWIEFERATESSTDVRLRELLRSGAAVASTHPVLMEILAGARTDIERARLRRVQLSLDWIPFDPEADFAGAAGVYASCRQSGFTPGGLVDCMIAAVALRSGAAILSADADFARIAEILPLRLDRQDP